MSPLALQVRRVTGSVVGRKVELGAIRQELAAARAGRLTALTLEGEPGIGKTRLLVAAAELAAAEGFMPVAVTADEEIRGPFLLARGIFASSVAQEHGSNGAGAQLQRVLDAISGHDDPTLAGLSPDQNLLGCSISPPSPSARSPPPSRLHCSSTISSGPTRTACGCSATSPAPPQTCRSSLGLATRPEELAVVREAVTLIADMERMGMVRRLKLARFTQLETTEFLQHVLGGELNLSSAATMHAQAEGVAFIVEELARTYREMALIQEIDGVWTLARNAERLVPSAVRTLIQRRAARLPDETKRGLADAAILGRSFSLKDLRSIKVHLGADDLDCDPTVLAESLAPAVQAGLLVEHPAESPADFSFTHEQVREFAAAMLNAGRRRAIHAALVDLLTADGDPPPASLSLLAQHALAGGDPDRAVRFSISAARAALDARAAEEALRVVDLALPAASAAQDRVALLTSRTRLSTCCVAPPTASKASRSWPPWPRLWGTRTRAQRQAATRCGIARVGGRGSSGRAGTVRARGSERAATAAELAACLELGQNLLRSPLGESFGAPRDVDLDGAEEAYARACELAEELGDVAALAAASRELGVISISRAREWYVERVERGEVGPIMTRIAAGETPARSCRTCPSRRLSIEGVAHYERAIELFEQIGDRRGVMSTIIARAYVNFGIDIHLLGAAKRIEEIRRLASQLTSLTRESERAAAEAQMLYGVQVFARAKVVPDLALTRGEEAHRHARLLGDRSLEFATAVGLGLTHLELGDLDQAEQWLDRAARSRSRPDSSPRAPAVLRPWNDPGRGRRCRRNARALGAGSPARDGAGKAGSQCEALATLALEAALLGVETSDEGLLGLAETSALAAKELVTVLPGHPPWGAEADSALAQVALARGAHEAAEAARSALETLQTRTSRTSSCGLSFRRPASFSTREPRRSAPRSSISSRWPRRSSPGESRTSAFACSGSAARWAASCRGSPEALLARNRAKRRRGKHMPPSSARTTPVCSGSWSRGGQPGDRCRARRERGRRRPAPGRDVRGDRRVVTRAGGDVRLPTRSRVKCFEHGSTGIAASARGTASPSPRRPSTG